jgi:hypothetical protein
VTVSLYGTAIWAMSVIITSAQQMYGYQYPKGRYDPGATPYRTKDGSGFTIHHSGIRPLFPGSLRVLGVPEWPKIPGSRP